MKKPKTFGTRQTSGWVDALAPARLDLQSVAPTDAILYDAAGKRIGVMDRITRERKYDR